MPDPGDIYRDLVDELDRLEAILEELDEDEWASPSLAPGWSVADVVLHLAQTEEAVVNTAQAGEGEAGLRRGAGEDLDGAMDRMVRTERTNHAATFERWRRARRAAVAAMQAADPERPLRWAAAPLKPRTLATTRLAEHWAHGLDIVMPLGIDFPDTDRLRHIAWLGHASLPYAFGVEGVEPEVVACELTAPSGAVWHFGPDDAPWRITGSGAAFCRVGARRLAPEQSGLRTNGPGADAALRVLRNYAA